MKIYVKAFLISALVGIFVYGVIFFLDKESSSSHKTQVLDRMSRLKQWEEQGVEDFSVTGSEFLSHFSHPVKIVHFWASWCGPCVEEIPSLQKLVEHMGDQVLVLALSQDQSQEEMETFLKENGWSSQKNLRFIFDQKPGVGALFQVQKLPESFILDPKNRLKKRIPGAIDWMTSESVSFFEQLTKAL
jgi:cytochrome c biogenesis protein CcmG, thiol:disulfide interchange protein DsbE